MFADNRLKDAFEELQKEKAPKENLNYITKSEIQKLLRCDYRTTDFYVRQNLLRPSVRIGKEAAWERDYVVDEIRAIQLLNQDFKVPLTDIATIARITDFNISNVAIDSLGIIDAFYEQMEQDYEKIFRNLIRKDRFYLSRHIFHYYFKLILTDTPKAKRALGTFLNDVEKKYVPKLKDNLTRLDKYSISRESDKTHELIAREVFGK